MTASASSSFFSEPASNAFDGSPSTYWTTNGFATGWVQNQLGAPLTALVYSITRRDDIPTRNPTAWTFLGSNDGSTWTTLDTQSGITWPTSGEVKSFSFTNSTAYSYYRLDVSANAGDTYLSVAELAVSATLDASVSPPVATATAQAFAPVIDDGHVDASVSPPVASATAQAFAPTFEQTILAGTDTSNSLNGRRRRARASVVVVRPAAAAPSRAAVKYDKSVPYPPPTLVNGRPT